MYVLQYRSYYFNLFTQNLCTSSLKFLRNKSCSLSSLLFTSLCLEFSSSPQRHFSLSYSCSKLKKNHSIVSLFSLELKPLADKLPHLQGVVVFWILITIIPLPLITVSGYCYERKKLSDLWKSRLSDGTRWQLLHSTAKKKHAILHSPSHVFMSNAWNFACQEKELWFVLAQNGTQLS